MSMSGWIGVDLDGTLAHYEGYDAGRIGKPVEPMLERVKKWIAQGIEVRIVTARADAEEDVARIEDWLESVGIPGLAVTNQKDYRMIELWDDRAVSVEMNTGRILTEGRTEE